MPEMIEVVHRVTGDTCNIPVDALESQRELGWAPVTESAPAGRVAPPLEDV